MKALSQKRNTPLFLTLAFLIPAVGMLCVMLLSQYEPFGQYSILYSDMYHQYFPFFVAFRKALLSGDSLLHSWSVGLGMDYLGLISYYLGSPLYLLSVLVPEGFLLEFFSLLVPIKLGLAGLFFGIFLKNTFRKNDLSIAIFGSFYATCAWALGYQWNIMWLDTFALLPLVALGTVSLLRDKKFVLYTVSLFFSIFANYYIGFFTCIFVFLTFICYEICRFQGFKRLFFDLLRIALFSALAIGMTAILELPALAALQNTQSSVNEFPKEFRLNMVTSHNWAGLWEAMKKVAGNMNGGITPTFKEGLPNLYCGIGTIFLAFLFLTCKKVRIRDKICAVLLLLFFMVSFIIRQLDYVWHGFHFTNMIPYRFSFLFSFVLLYMAYRAYLLRWQLKLWQVLVAGALSVGIFLCSDLTKDPAFLAYNLVFIVLYLSLWICYCLPLPYPKDGQQNEKKAFFRHRRQRRTIAAWALVGVMGAELILNFLNFGLSFQGTTVSSYPRGMENLSAAVEYMQQTDKDPFYRAEVTHSQTLNDAALIGYNGISTFTSSANVNVTKFMQALGFAAKDTYNRYCFEEASPVANLFLGLKYMLERDGVVDDNPYFDTVQSFGNVHLMENNTYLPLGFLADSALAETEFLNFSNRFDFQNRLLGNASGVPNVWTKLTGKNLTITSDKATVSSRTDSGYCYYTTKGSSATVIYRYTTEYAGFLCVDLNLSKKNSYTVWKNGEYLFSESYSLPQMIAITHMQPGDVVEISFTCKANELGTMDVKGAILNEIPFRKAYEALNASTLQLTTFRNTLVSGTINCNRDGVLYTSIPQDGNWIATVDGKPAETVLIGNAMIGVLVTEGQHTVTFTYRNSAFSLGWKVSLCSLLIFLLLCFFFYPKMQLYKGKHQAQKTK